MNYCGDCKANYKLDYIINSINIPLCKKYEEIMKGDVVLYQEPLKRHMINKAIKYI